MFRWLHRDILEGYLHSLGAGYHDITPLGAEIVGLRYGDGPRHDIFRVELVDPTIPGIIPWFYITYWVHDDSYRAYMWSQQILTRGDGKYLAVSYAAYPVKRGWAYITRAKPTHVPTRQQLMGIIARMADETR